jgi:hypothetical protein
MKLCKHSGIRYFDIHHPRYHDKRVLLACHKVGTHNIIRFSQAKSLEGLFYIEGRTVRKYKIENNGAIDVYAVLLSDLEPFELSEHCEHEI